MAKAPDNLPAVPQKRVDLLVKTLSNSTGAAWLAGIPVTLSGLSIMFGSVPLFGFLLSALGIYGLVAGWMASRARRQLVARAPDGPHLARSALLVVAPGAGIVGLGAAYYLWMSVSTLVASGFHGGALLFTAALSSLAVLISWRVLTLLVGLLRSDELDQMFWEEAERGMAEPEVLEDQHHVDAEESERELLVAESTEARSP